MHTIEGKDKEALLFILGACTRSSEYLMECHANGAIFYFAPSLQDTCLGLVSLITAMEKKLSEEVRTLLIHEHGKPLPDLEKCFYWNDSCTYDKSYLFDILKDELPRLELACCKLLHTEEISTRNLPKSLSDIIKDEWLIECCSYESGDMYWSDVYYDYKHDRFYVCATTVSGVDCSGDRSAGRWDLPKQTAMSLMTDEEKEKLAKEIQRRKHLSESN